MKPAFLFAVTLALALTIGQDASAYIGPGAGLSMLGAFWGVVIAVLAALSFLLLWPIRRMFKKSSATSANTTEAGAEVDGEDKPAG